MHRLPGHLRSDETGVGLIEVVVSAMLVVLVALGVYAGLDAASATSGINKHRSLASELAQQDQDRMRAMALVELSNHRGSRRLRVGTVEYTVSSKADWVTDRTGTSTCTGTDARANYIRISTQVSWDNMRIRPIDVASLVAPPSGSFGPNQGSLAVQVNDRDGVGLPGVTVSLAGPKAYTDTTNAEGCVLWGYLPVGNYTVTLSRAGHIDPQGVAQPSRAVSVVGQATNSVAFDYDAAATIVASFETVDGAPTTGAAFSTVSPSSLRTAHGAGVRTASIESSPLFPFASGFGVYAGACDGNDPFGHGLLPLTVAVEPGQSTPVSLHQPPIDLQVVDGPAPVGGAVVKLVGTGSGCGALPPVTTGADGYIPERPHPLGTYTACTDFLLAGRTQHVRTTIANTALVGVAARLDRLSPPTAGACP